MAVSHCFSKEMDPYNGGNYNQQYIEALLFNSEAQPHQVNHQAQVHPVNHQAQVHHQEYQPQPQPHPVKHQVNQAYDIVYRRTPRLHTAKPSAVYLPCFIHSGGLYTEVPLNSLNKYS